MKRILALLLAILVLTSANFSFASVPGGVDDPLISLSYMPEYISNILSRAEILIDESLGSLKDSINERLEGLNLDGPDDGGYSNGYKTLYLNSGGTVAINMGGSLNLISGKALLTELSGTIINITDGTVVGKGQALKPNNRYFAAEDSYAEATIYSDTAVIAVDGKYSMTESGELPDNTIFSDISGHWAREYIEYLAINGIVNGMGAGAFEPELSMNRAMFVTVIGRLFGADTEAYTDPDFTDVDLGTWYGPYVAWAAEKGIVNGYGDGTFMPTQAISREQMALIIIRYAEYCGVSLPEPFPPVLFSDDETISSW